MATKEDDEDEAWYEKLLAGKRAFVAMVAKAVEEDGGYAAPMQGSPGDWVTITPSTYPGIEWQVTRWIGDPLTGAAEPIGHRDAMTIEDAALELREWVERQERGGAIRRTIRR